MQEAIHLKHPKMSAAKNWVLLRDNISCTTVVAYAAATCQG
jgi:hypothetical protein